MVLDPVLRGDGCRLRQSEMDSLSVSSAPMEGGITADRYLTWCRINGQSDAWERDPSRDRVSPYVSTRSYTIPG